MQIELGPSNATLSVHTARAGVAAKAGHDLVLEARRWWGSLTLDPDDEGGGSGSRLELRVDADGLEVRAATGGVKPLTESDRDAITDNLARKVLHTDHHPEIHFASTAIEPAGRGAYSVAGDLALAGTTRPVRFELEVTEEAGGTVLRASAAIDQSDFGIKPFSALMGTLKVADRVEIHAEAHA